MELIKIYCVGVDGHYEGYDPIPRSELDRARRYDLHCPEDEIESWSTLYRLGDGRLALEQFDPWEGGTEFCWVTPRQAIGECQKRDRRIPSWLEDLLAENDPSRSRVQLTQSESGSEGFLGRGPSADPLVALVDELNRDGKHVPAKMVSFFRDRDAAEFREVTNAIRGPGAEVVVGTIRSWASKVNLILRKLPPQHRFTLCVREKRIVKYQPCK